MGDGAGNGPDGTVDGDDPWYRFVYDDAWRVIAVYRGSDDDPKEQFVHHAAGLGGMGGSCYIDAVVLRDRDANTAWASASDGTLEERRAYAQNWRGDVAAVLSDNGKMVEWVKYSAYGVPFALPAGDDDSDGAWDAGDAMTDPTGYDVRWDADLDGDTDAADDTHANSIAGGYQTGRTSRRCRGGGCQPATGGVLVRPLGGAVCIQLHSRDAKPSLATIAAPSGRSSRRAPSRRSRISPLGWVGTRPDASPQQGPVAAPMQPTPCPSLREGS